MSFCITYHTITLLVAVGAALSWSAPALAQTNGGSSFPLEPESNKTHHVTDRLKLASTPESTTEASYQEANRTEDGPLMVMQALNAISVSVNRITNSKDKLVLDMEYSRIINNLRRGSNGVPFSPELSISFTQLLNTINQLLIGEKEREVIRTIYESQCRQAVYNGISNIRAYGGSPSSVLLSLAVSAGSAYFNVKSTQEQYKQEVTRENWRIEEDDINAINEMNISLLNSSWQLMQRHGFKDEDRLSNNDLNRYTEAISTEVPEKALGKLKDLKKYFQLFPPFWFYMTYFETEAAEQVKETNPKQANEHMSRARECMLHYEEIYRPIFRMDPFRARMASLQLKYFSEPSYTDTETIKRRIEILLENAEPEEGIYQLLAAIYYSDIDEYDLAVACLERNIRNGSLEFISRKMIDILGKPTNSKSSFIELAECLSKVNELKKVKSIDDIGELILLEALDAYPTEGSIECFKGVCNALTNDWDQSIPLLETASSKGNKLATLCLADYNALKGLWPMYPEGILNVMKQLPYEGTPIAWEHFRPSLLSMAIGLEYTIAYNILTRVDDPSQNTLCDQYASVLFSHCREFRNRIDSFRWNESCAKSLQMYIDLASDGYLPAARKIFVILSPAFGSDDPSSLGGYALQAIIDGYGMNDSFFIPLCILCSQSALAEAVTAQDRLLQLSTDSSESVSIRLISASTLEKLSVRADVSRRAYNSISSQNGPWGQMASVRSYCLENPILVEDLGNMFLYDRIPKKLLAGFCESYGKGASSSDVLCLYDDTWRKNGSSGFAVTCNEVINSDGIRIPLGELSTDAYVDKYTEYKLFTRYAIMVKDTKFATLKSEQQASAVVSVINKVRKQCR